MSVNKNKPHVYVIPEDRRDAQIANGFAQHPSINGRQIYVVEEAGGWSHVLGTFKQEYLQLLEQNQNVHVVMLIDFDGRPEERRRRFQSEIPEGLRARVFVIGPRDTPEALRGALAAGGRYEAIGRSLASECESDSLETWMHEHLRHNAP